MEIESFTFGGVYDQLYFWSVTDNGGDGGPTTKKYKQKWVRGGGGDNAAVYKFGAFPIFKAPVVKITPTAPPTTVSVRVLSGGSEIARRDGITISGVSSTLPDITCSATSSEVQFQLLKLDWEVSFNGGTTWKSMGSTDYLSFYWIVGAPTISKVFDYGLWWACTSIYDYDSTDYPLALTEEIADWIDYLPSRGTPPGYMDESGLVLQVLQIPGGQCLSNSYLLHYLLQSIGTASGDVKAYWAGTGIANWIRWDFTGVNPVPPCVNFHADAQLGCSNFNADRPARSLGVAKNPRFTFHAMVVLGTTTYDPSYGLTGAAATADFYNMWNGCSKQTGTWANYIATGRVFLC